jgi:hypothetical protein
MRRVVNPVTDASDTPAAADSEADDPAAGGTRAERMMTQLGGLSGVIYSSLPVLVFAGTSRLLGLSAAVAAALGTATLILVWRLIRRESVQPAISGLIGVAICALIAYAMGETKGYFLLGIWSSLVYAAIFGLSILIRRPVVGYIWSWLHGHDRTWRDVRRAVFVFDIATFTWVVVFGARFVVQRWLYDSDHTGWLLVARITMGWPLAAAAAAVTYLAIKAAQRALEAAEAAEAAAVTAPATAADAAPPPRQ